MDQKRLRAWRPAILWALKISLAHRIVLLAWMAFVWLAIGKPLNIPVDLHIDPVARLPVLDSVEQATLGVWRRWDASHYLNLAQNGYRVDDPGPTVFGILTPIGIRLFDLLLPGGLDLGGMVFATAAFWLALVMLYRVCEAYYDDGGLGRWATIVLALLPHSFFFSAPMSEAIYLAMALGLVYAAAKSSWAWAALCGVLATLARSQGVLLLGTGVLLLWEQSSAQGEAIQQCIRSVIRQGWILALIPLALAAFLVFRQINELPPLNDIYRVHSFIFFVNPLEGLRLNLSWALAHPGEAVLNSDIWALAVSLGLTIWTARTPRHWRLPLLVYTASSILVFVTKINWAWGDTTTVTYTQSFARYSLALFPLTILIADKLRTAPGWVRIIVLGLSGCGLLVFSALFTLGGGTP